MNPKTLLNIQRGLVYLFLAILLVITLIPIWMLLVNATRSTTQIQQGVGFLPSVYLVSNYKILLSQRSGPAPRFPQQLHHRHCDHRCIGLFCLPDSLWHRGL